jgi:hypothetical protein
LIDGHREAGPHTVRWDGRDGGGHAAAAGIYFLRLESAGTTVTKRVPVIP